jgi:hypothetical protein
MKKKLKLQFTTYFLTVLRSYALTLFLSFILSSFCFAQSGYQIRIKTEEIKADSLFIKSYHVKSKKFTNFLSVKFENDITLKDKTPLDAGIYIIEVDSMLLSEFLISDTKNQKFTISFLKDDIKIEGSKENSANRIYIKQMMEFRMQERALDAELKMKQKELPAIMMQVVLDTFLVKFDRINVEKRAYQDEIINDYKGTLLASIVQCSKDPPPPPASYFRDFAKLQIYLSEHFFDAYTWDDERLLKTPVLYNKFKTFGQQLLQLDTEITIPIVLKALNASKKNRNLFFALFDFLEREFGNIKSPYRNEMLYIEMLRNILTMPDLEETRKKFYKYELNLITKNQAGELAVDFNILLSNGDTTNLYAIDAELLLIYFQNPDCPTCGEFREKMKNLEVLYKTISSGKVKVMTVYFEENEEIWRKYLKTSAFTNWIHGWNYDLEILEKHLYDIRIIPTIMVLDKDKKVIKKDIFPDEFEEWIKRNL